MQKFLLVHGTGSVRVSSYCLTYFSIKNRKNQKSRTTTLYIHNRGSELKRIRVYVYIEPGIINAEGDG